MASVLPNYNAETPPPSYDEVVKKLDSLVGSDPTPRKYLDAAQQLNEIEVKVIEDNTYDQAPVADEDVEAFESAAIQTLDDESEDYMAKAANDAIKASKAIETHFNNLARKIEEIDLIHKSDFLPTLQEHHETYNALMDESTSFADKLSVHAEEFDDITLELCTDEDLTPEERLELLKEHIADAEGYKGKAEEIKKAFEELLSDMNSLKAKFATWATEKEGELEQDIKDLEEDIQKLYEELSDVQAKMGYIGIAAAAGFVLFSGMAILGGPLTALVGIAGLLGVGGMAAAIAALAVKSASIERDIERKQEQIAEKQRQIEQIQDARVDLTSMGEEEMQEFQANIAYITTFWNATSSDAHQVQEWLEKGARHPDQPKYVKVYVEKGVRVYAKMAVYLDLYAKGIEVPGHTKKLESKAERLAKRKEKYLAILRKARSS